MNPIGTRHEIFVTGGTGYIGRRLIADLVGRGHSVRALARAGSEGRLPPGSKAVVGNALDAATFAASVHGCDTFVHLVGTPHPSPAKAAQFRSIDLPSVQQAALAAQQSGVTHFVYVSVAHPAPVMRAYIEARSEGERILRAAGLDTTILRPWYVLGPGHRWPYPLIPVYWFLERLPATREAALRLGLVTLDQMLGALGHAVENPPSGMRILEVPEIRKVKT
jgi:uncharacterized protein YbjT (DUF2867 family)